MNNSNPQFRIVSISASNYYGTDVSKLNGTVKIKHEGTDMTFDIKLTPKDCLDVFSIISNRVGAMFTEVATIARHDINEHMSDLLGQHVKQIEAAKADTPATEKNNDEYPF